MNETGKRGELAAESYLTDNGYTVTERNYHSRYGEIDIIAEKGGFIVFAEVKTRSKNTLIDGIYSVNESKQAKLIKTASLYLASVGSTLQPRFDVIVVEMNRGVFTVSKHIENAF